MISAIGRTRSRLPLFTLAGALTGLATAVTLQFYLMAYYYPTIVGGKEYRSWEAFTPVAAPPPRSSWWRRLFRGWAFRPAAPGRTAPGNGRR